MRDDRGDHPYHHLARWLYEEPFYSSVPADRNRIEEVIEGREVYSDKPKGDDVRVLEILVHLSLDMRDMMDGMIDNNSPDRWFLEMISNLGLAAMTDDRWEKETEDCAIITRGAIEEWLEREYDYDGTGGIFPLSDAKDDQTRVEIWYQMNAYLMEKMSKK